MVRGKFYLLRNLPKEVVIKGVLVLVLTVAAFGFYYIDKNLVKENQKMIKYIKNEEVFKRNLDILKENENLFRKYIIALEPRAADAELEKIKSGYIDDLLNIIRKQEIQVDSYRSEIEKKDGFVIFKYDITIIGDFVRVLRFFNRLMDGYKHIYVTRYDIRMNVNTLVRLGMTVEIMGME